MQQNINPSINFMQVSKRSGQKERVSFDKILRRIDVLCEELCLARIDTTEVAKETINGLFDGITTEEIDHLTAVNCSEKIRDDPQYDKLAAAVCVSRLHKMTTKDFMEVTDKLYNNADPFKKSNPLISQQYYDFVKENINEIQTVLDNSYKRDYDFDYFGYKTLEKGYLHRVKLDDFKQNIRDKVHKNVTIKNGSIVERPQHMWMRVALGLCQGDLKFGLETFEGLSNRCFIFGSPTLFNAGSQWPQCSSCFLLLMGDSIEDIYDTIKKIALISKRAGGIGVCVSNVRAAGSVIRGTNGVSSGVIPFIQELNWTGRAVNQGSRRLGAIACYIEPWHADIEHFCSLRSNKGKEEDRARDIFLALWIPDLFMRRVETNGVWTLMCPDECPGLTTTYGEEFEKLYMKYEAEGNFKKQMKAKDLWFHILSCQVEAGMPYMLYKDNINRQSNQKNVGVIQCSNLCSEITEFTSPDEVAVCNLSSLCLPKFLEKDNNGKYQFNFEKLRYIAGIAVRNLNHVIDINYYPVQEAKKSNNRHRPIGLGVQGLADVFCMLRLPYDSTEAKILNRKIFETIYFGALQMSNELAKIYGPYETFAGSPFSEGLLQFHLWGIHQSELLMGYDWDSLIESIKTFGTRNSLLTTVMPTASTSQIMGNFEACEPITSNVFTRTTSVGEFTVINKYLVEELINLGIWSLDIRNELIYDAGSIQNIANIPNDVKLIYRTAYELKNKPICDLAIERGGFIDQSQSHNLFQKVPDFDSLSSSHFYTWRKKLKTGLYYLRTQPAVDALKFGLDGDAVTSIKSRRQMASDEQAKSFINLDPCTSGACGA
jgi:ribonucleoside-diphosphate reductase alpha chain